MKFKPKGVKDIAEALQVSTSTVSRALTGQYGVSGEKRKMITEYAEKIHYRANPSALGLKQQRSHSIGVVVCEIANPFFSQAINGVDAVAYDKGYHVIITQSHESFQRELINMQHLASRSVDGLLVSLSSGTRDLSYLNSLMEQGLPVVFFDRVPEVPAHKIVSDNRNGAFDATRYLIQAGCKNVAHVTCSPHLLIAQERMNGYRQALLNSGLPFREQYVEYCEHGGIDQAETDVAIDRLMCLPNKPDGIFISNDKLSTGVLSALKRYDQGLRSDIRLAGFTNSNLVELLESKLTPVRQRAYEMGQKATDLLIQLIEGRKAANDFQTCALDTELMSHDAGLLLNQRQLNSPVLKRIYA